MDWASVVLGAFIGVAGVFGLTALALYPLMRRTFLLWNAARTASFCVLALVMLPKTSGDRTILGLGPAGANDIGVALIVALTGPLLASYLEPLPGFRRLRRFLRLTFPIGLVAGLATILSPRLPVLSLIHDILIVLAIVIVVRSLVQAIRAGSRIARYQAIAWGPLIVVGLLELSYEIATGREYWLWPLVVLVAVIFDFVVSVLGLIDGFMAIKGERDLAIADMREATRASTLDPLTGIANRRGLARRFDDQAIGRPLALAVVDCDHFKRINDNFGHDVGDEVLIAVADALMGDGLYVGRLGGEEFIVLFYRPEWQLRAEEARRRAEIGVRLRTPQLTHRVTASAGITEVRDDDTLESAIKRADRALYAAKDGGRDRSVVHGDTGSLHQHLPLAV